MSTAIYLKEGERIPSSRLCYLKDVDRVSPKRRRALFSCDCGQTIERDLHWVRFGNISSCGCFKSEVIASENTKHSNAIRGSASGAYRSWAALHQRVKVNPLYKHVSVCERWSGDSGFSNFLSDMGDRPEGYSIERLDNLKGYEPSNCIWADVKTQARNRSTTARVTIVGITHPIVKWCELIGIAYSAVKQRRKRGMSIEDAIMTPLNVAKQRLRK